MGIEIQKNIMINRPHEEVFAFISNFENDGDWSTAVSTASYLKGGPGQVGSTVRFVANFLSRDIETIGETTAHEPNKKVGFKLIKGTVTGQGSREVEAVGNTTRVTQNFDFEFGGVFKAVKFLLKPALKKQMDTDLNKLKAVLEG